MRASRQRSILFIELYVSDPLFRGIDGAYLRWPVGNSKYLDRLEEVCEARLSKARLLCKYLFMKLDSMTETFDLGTVRAGSRRDWVRAMTLSLVVTGSFLLQGCLAGAWVALVSVDSMRDSNVIFGPFEQSWVAEQDQSSDAVHDLKVTSVAVLPVEGDPEMGARLATLLQQETALRVEVPTSIAAGVTAADPRSAEADDADRSALAEKSHAGSGRRYCSRQSRCRRFAFSSERLGVGSRGFTTSLSVPRESRRPSALER